MSSTSQSPPLALHMVQAGYVSVSFGLFGGLWMLLALNQETLVWIVACVLLPASLLVVRGVGLTLAGRRILAQQPGAAAAGFAAWQSQRRGFGWIVMIEIAAILVAVNLLPAYGWSRWTVAAIAFIVAVHFLPMARILADRIYLFTAGIEIFLCLVISLLMRGRIALADPLFGLVMGLSLWLTALALLLRGHRIGGLLSREAAIETH